MDTALEARLDGSRRDAPVVRYRTDRDTGRGMMIPSGRCSRGHGNAGAAGGGAIYGLGIFGALIYYRQQADGFWEYAFAFIQGVFWPAYLVYEVLASLGA